MLYFIISFFLKGGRLLKSVIEQMYDGFYFPCLATALFAITYVMLHYPETD